MADIKDLTKDAKEFAEILRNLKGEDVKYKAFAAGAIAGAKLACKEKESEKKAG